MKEMHLFHYLIEVKLEVKQISLEKGVLISLNNLLLSKSTFEKIRAGLKHKATYKRATWW